MKLLNLLKQGLTLRKFGKGKILVLAYHDIVTEPVHNEFQVHLNTFTQQVQALKLFCNITDPDHIIPAPAHKPSVLITFDDGWKSHAKLVAPLLHKLKVQGLFFISSGFCQRDAFCTEDELRLLQAYGMRIGSHGIDHPDFGTLTETEYGRQLKESGEQLSKIITTPIRHFAYPYGGVQNRLAHDEPAITAAGYKWSFAFGNAQPGPWPTPFGIGRHHVMNVAGVTLLEQLVTVCRKAPPKPPEGGLL